MHRGKHANGSKLLQECRIRYNSLPTVNTSVTCSSVLFLPLGIQTVFSATATFVISQRLERDYSLHKNRSTPNSNHHRSMYHLGSGRHLDPVGLPVGQSSSGLELVTLVLSVYIPFHVNATDE
jgi:hypothetical protein